MPQSWTVEPSGILLGAVALDDVRAVAEVGLEIAPELAGPVDGRAAEALAGIERSVLAHRQRGRARVGPPRPRLACEVDHHRVAHRVAQAVVVVRELGVRPARRALLERDHLDAVRTQPRAEDRRRPARADRDHVHLRVCHRHQCTPRVSPVPLIGRKTCGACTPGLSTIISRRPCRRLCCGPCLSS